MADNTTKETVIFEIDVTSYTRSLAELSNSINALKADQKQYHEDAKKGIAGAAEAYEKVTVQLKNQQQAYRTKQSALAGYTASQKAGADVNNFYNNSIQTNRDLLKQLTAEYIKTKNPSEELTKKVKELSDALKKQEGAIGDTRRNVGNYAAGFKEAIGGIISGVPALKGFQTAQLGVNAAMNANPIGGVITLLMGLVEVFKQNATVADQVSFAIDGITKGLGSIIDTIVDTVTNFDKLTKALANPFKFFSDLAKGAAQAAKEGYQAAQALDEMQVASAKLNAEIKRNQSQIDSLTKSLKDRTKSEKERIQIANTIADLEIKNSEKQKKAAEEILRIEQLKLKDRKLSGEQQAKLIELESNVQQAADEAQIISAQRQTRINILLDKQANTAAKEASQERIKIKQEELKSLSALIEKEEAAKAKKYEDETQRELEALVRREELIAERVGSPSALIEAEELKRNLLLQNESLTATERENIISESENRILGIKKQAAERDLKLAKDTAAEKKSVQQAELTFAAGVSDALIGFIGDVANASGAGAAFQKTLAGIEIGVKTAVALAGAISQAQSVPFPANLAAIGAGIAAVLGGVASAVSLLKKTPNVPKFARGVIGLDGEGTETSDSVPAMLSKGESVVTAKATKKFHRELAHMEMSVGNKPNYNFGNGMFAGGIIGDAGFSTREIQTSGMARIETQLAIKEAFKSMPNPVVSVKEIARVTKSVERSVRVSEA